MHLCTHIFAVYFESRKLGQLKYKTDTSSPETRMCLWDLEMSVWIKLESIVQILKRFWTADKKDGGSQFYM
jgi:hypothetical protein